MKEKKRVSAYKKLKEGIENVISSGKYKQFLKFMNKFHRYSFNNSLLIFSQKPDATQVAGYCTWKEVGRGVKSNPHKIFILQPIKYRATKEDNENTQDVEKDEELKQLVGFKWTIVYDISDTYIIDEKKAEEFNINLMEETRLNSNSSQKLYNILLKVSPVKVLVEHIGDGSDGYYSKTENKIVISSELSLDDRTATLLHEITHALYDDFNYSKERNLSEIFVESVAYITADYFGLDTGKCSFIYIMNWSKGNSKEILKIGEKIQQTSNKLIERIKEQIKLLD